MINNVFSYYDVVFILRVDSENREESVTVYARKRDDAVVIATRKLIEDDLYDKIITVDRVCMLNHLREALTSNCTK